PDPDRKLIVVEGNWLDEASQRNAGLELCCAAGAKYCFVVDADEIYDSTQLERMMDVATNVPDVDVWAVTNVTYWKSYLYVVHPRDAAGSTVFVRTTGVRFISMRTTNAMRVGCFSPSLGCCHHLSYARTDDQLIKKLARFSHAHEISGDW